MLGVGASNDQAKETVKLDDLKFLHLGFMGYAMVAISFRLTSPRFSPLWLTIDFCKNKNSPTQIFEQDLTEFLDYPNITRLELRGPDSYSWASGLISQTSDLDVLALEGIVRDGAMLQAQPSLQSIINMHISKSEINVSALRKMIEDYSVPVTILWRRILPNESDMDEEIVDIDTVEIGFDVEILDSCGPGLIEKLEEGISWD